MLHDVTSLRALQRHAQRCVATLAGRLAERLGQLDGQPLQRRVELELAVGAGEVQAQLVRQFPPGRQRRLDIQPRCQALERDAALCLDTRCRAAPTTSGYCATAHRSAERLRVDIAGAEAFFAVVTEMPA